MSSFRYYLFGMDAEAPEECARELRARGIDTVVQPPSPRAAEACRAAGLAVYACVGAFSLREGDPEAFLAEDAFGRRGEWFHSGCPNEPALRERFLRRTAERIAELGADGAFLDGARFASPEPEGSVFPSCFCPRCMAEGERMGFDMDRMRHDVREFVTRPGTEAPAQWLRFRGLCAGRAIVSFVEAVRAAGPLRAGVFAFAPSLAPLVGQAGVYGETAPDIAAPMLYRRYAPRPGIACLNAEYAALLGLFRAKGEERPAEAVWRMTGVRLPQDEPAILRAEGFPPEAVGGETQAARAAIDAAGSRALLAPILQLEDEALAASVASARAAGAEAVGFFAWNREHLRYLPELP